MGKRRQGAEKVRAKYRSSKWRLMPSSEVELSSALKEKGDVMGNAGGEDAGRGEMDGVPRAETREDKQRQWNFAKEVLSLDARVVWRESLSFLPFLVFLLFLPRTRFSRRSSRPSSLDEG